MVEEETVIAGHWFEADEIRKYGDLPVPLTFELLQTIETVPDP